MHFLMALPGVGGRDLAVSHFVWGHEKYSAPLYP
jgi:hypothetical protein